MPFDFSQLFSAFAPTVSQNRPDYSSFEETSVSPQRQQGGLNRLMELLQNQPQREEPSILRRIGATLGGLSPAGYTQTGAPRGIQFSPERTEKIKYAPYERKLKDWKEQLTGALPLAELEQKSKQEERMLRGQTFDQQIESAKFIQQIKKDALAGKLDETRIKEIENNIKKGDFLNLGQQDDGSYLLLDRNTNEPINIPSNNLTTEQKIRLTQSAISQRQTMLERTRQAGQVELEGMRQEGRTELEKTRQEGRERLHRDGTELSPTQQGRDIYNNAMQVINENPDLAPYIELLPNNTVRIVPSDEVNLPGIDMFSGADKEGNRARALQLVFGGEVTGDTELRNEAMNLLKGRGMPSTEANIKYVMEQLRGKKE